MEKGLVELSEYRKKKNIADFHGKSAYCFLIGNKIIKIYANNNDQFYMSLDRNKINDLSSFKSNLILFPLEYLYENGRIEGEISKFIPDKSLENGALNDRTMILPLLRHYREIINEIKKFNELDMIDLCTSNVCYSGKNGFHIYDTTEWQFTDRMDNNNVRRFDFQLFNQLLDYLNFPSFFHDFINTRIMYNVIRGKYGKIGSDFLDTIQYNLMDDYHIEDFLILYMEMYKIYYNSEMKTLGQMKKYTKILKKG